MATGGPTSSKRFGGAAKERAYGTAMRIYKGYLYFSSELNVYRYKLTPGELVPESPKEIILTDDHAHGMHEHIAKPVTFDNRGPYVRCLRGHFQRLSGKKPDAQLAGIDPCPMLEDHGGIWRFDANKTGQTQKDGYRYATGLRSVVALDWNSDR